MVTIFKNIFSKDPFYVSVEDALKRISDGKSKSKVEEIRSQIDKEKSNKLKANLPSICFSGKFGKNRKDEEIIEHSGFLVLDFDNVYELREKQTEIISHDFVYACWVSPSGNGLKALIKIADGDKHREHMKQFFREILAFKFGKLNLLKNKIMRKYLDRHMKIDQKLVSKVAKLAEIREKC
jgi:hypothetical protein